MLCNEFTFLSADGKTPIHAAEWLPDGQIRAVLQISHGVAEYILRYEPFAEFLTERGFAVVGHDHLGHGQSVLQGASRLYFGTKGSWNWVVDDIETRRRMAVSHFPGVPHFLLGHSMGSFLARTYLIRYPGSVSGAILMGTGQMSPAILAGGKAVAAAESRRIGLENPSPLMDRLVFGPYNKKFAPNRTDLDWLSANEDNVDAYIADPLCGGSASVGLFREMLNGLSFIAKAENLKKMNLNTPVLFVSGGDDPLGDCGKGVQKAFRSFQKVGVRDVSMKLYPGLRHEILNEDSRSEVFADLYQWMDGQISGVPVSFV